MTYKSNKQQPYYSPNKVQSYFVFHSLIDYLKNKGERWEFNKNGYDDLKSLNDDINKIKIKYNLENETSNFISSFNAIKSSLINEELNWIKNNFRAALYLWFQWDLFPNKSSELFIEKSTNTPTDFNEVISDICDNFFFNYREMDKLKRRIQRIHTEWQKSSEKKRLTWLDVNNLEQSEWAHKYLCGKDRSFRRKFICDPINQGVVVQVFYDINYNDNGIKFIFNEMNNAWNQCKYRKANSDKKALSGYISQDAKMKLTEMAKKARMPEYELIELMILEYYDAENKQ